MRTPLLPCLALCMLFAHAPRAGAHAFLEHASPPVGGTVSTPPTEIGLQFSEAIEPAFSHITLATKAGDAVEIGAVSLDPNDSTRLVAVVRSTLAPGVYKSELARGLGRHAQHRRRLHVRGETVMRD